MSLQWFPGHMTKARRELAALMPSQDVVIEVLDARLPRASSNPVITELRGAKPAIKVLTKSDLADPEVTRAWIEHFSAEPNVTAFASTTDKPNVTRKRIAELTRGLAMHRGAGGMMRLRAVFHAQSPRHIERCAELGRHAPSEGESASPVRS